MATQLVLPLDVATGRAPAGPVSPSWPRWTERPLPVNGPVCRELRQAVADLVATAGRFGADPRCALEGLSSMLAAAQHADWTDYPPTAAIAAVRAWRDRGLGALARERLALEDAHDRGRVNPR
ncbi:MAG: hypothetical protein M0P31_08470 [Solirubrobacteraceae bacterium]|nr:hypothetical protein [Solirubrobacteraceae bacterium]